METLNLIKRDLVCLLAACALVPVAAFVAGFALAGGGGSSAPSPVQPLSQAGLIERSDCGERPATAAEVEQSSQSSPQASVELLPEPSVDESPSQAPEAAPQETLAAVEPLPVDVAGPVESREQFLLQAGVFSTEGSARSHQGTLARQGISARVVPMTREGDELYRVVVGSFSSLERAEQRQRKLSKSHDLSLYVASVERPAALVAGL